MDDNFITISQLSHCKWVKDIANPAFISLMVDVLRWNFFLSTLWISYWEYESEQIHTLEPTMLLKKVFFKEVWHVWNKSPSLLIIATSNYKPIGKSQGMQANWFCYFFFGGTPDLDQWQNPIAAAAAAPVPNSPFWATQKWPKISIGSMYHSAESVWWDGWHRLMNIHISSCMREGNVHAFIQTPGDWVVNVSNTSALLCLVDVGNYTLLRGDYRSQTNLNQIIYLLVVHYDSV